MWKWLILVIIITLSSMAHFDLFPLIVSRPATGSFSTLKSEKRKIAELWLLFSQLVYYIMINIVQSDLLEK